VVEREQESGSGRGGKKRGEEEGGKEREGGREGGTVKEGDKARQARRRSEVKGDILYSCILTNTTGHKWIALQLPNPPFDQAPRSLVGSRRVSGEWNTVGRGEPGYCTLQAEQSWRNNMEVIWYAASRMFDET
jgi:hypothetical protein